MDPVHAIANLKARYCAAADSAPDDEAGARAAMAEIFTADASGDYGFGPLNGAGALAEYLCTAIAGNSEWLLHMLHSPWIEIDGETAVGRWTVLVHLKRHESGAIDVVRGRYTDRFRWVDGAWRISEIGFSRRE
ncbi:nuclear transport factor 2 family protein [Stakelama tenebrarum]|uniref:Nuclear transport factor 2 family protein n=1 Tax=Stakelama tenebrarum TaxID=2711215 RepID=A0A6G6Y7D8_9SPHN|nr:nuclear transport factor 2 family protein [Sphingosinithalassobacter tenebrarum]QIG80830.1 nuclear transport factor 2 family protein [Sphingosinithalassobacter tenebrarum]